MRVSVVQMNPGEDKLANIAQAARLIDGVVASDRPGIVSLPEIWTCLGGTRARMRSTRPRKSRSHGA